MESTNPRATTPPADSTHARGTRVSAARRRAGALLAVVVLAALALVLWQTWDYWRPARDDDDRSAYRGPRGGGAGTFAGGPPPGAFDAQAMRRQLHDRIRTALAAGDEEWARIEPKLERVTSIQERLRPVPAGMAPPPFGGQRGVPPVAAPAPPPNPLAASGSDDLAEKSAMLRNAVEDEHTSPEALAANLAAARAARTKLVAELKSAQDNLRQQVTPRQEAILVTFGILD